MPTKRTTGAPRAPRKRKGSASTASTAPISSGHKRSSHVLLFSILGLSIAAVMAFGLYLSRPPEAPVKVVERPPMQDVVEDIIEPKPAFASGFATYKEEAVEVKPSVVPYQVQAGMKNVANAADFTFS